MTRVLKSRFLGGGPVSAVVTIYPPAAAERDGRSSTVPKPDVLTRAGERGHGKRENGTFVRSVNGRSDGIPVIGASIAYPPNPLGTFSTNSRCTTLPRRGTTRGTVRP